MRKVEVIVDGKREGAPLHMVDGDQLLFTMPGSLKNGKVEILEAENHRLKQQVHGWGSRVANLEQVIYEMVHARSHLEAIGIAQRSGVPLEER